MIRRRQAKAVIFAGVFAIFAFQEVAHAAEWSALPSIKMREGYDSNVLLTTAPHNGVTSTWVTPRMDFGIASDIWRVGGGVELSRGRFPGHHELDSDAVNLNLLSSYKTERSVWQFNAASSKSSYLAGTQISPNIGLFSQNTDSDTKTVNPSWTWSMTELTQLQLAYSQSDVSYVNGESVGLFDYRSSAVNVTLTHQLDLKTQVFFMPSYSIFRVPATTFESKTGSYLVGVSRNISETMSWTFYVGGRNTLNEQSASLCILYFGPFCQRTTQETASSRDSSSQFNASLDKQFEQVHLNAAVGRSFSPSAIGQQVRDDSVSLSLSKPLTEKLTGNLLFYGNKYSSETGQVSGIDRTVYQISPVLRWQWTPEWNLETAYSYTRLRQFGVSQTATSNAAYLTVIYQWPKISISR